MEAISKAIRPLQWNILANTIDLLVVTTILIRLTRTKSAMAARTLMVSGMSTLTTGCRGTKNSMELLH